MNLHASARRALVFAGVTVTYVASGKLGLDLAFASSSVTAIWPPTGIALAALILGGYRLWPAVALGALITNIGTGVPPGTVLGITVGNTLEALVGAYLLNRVAGFQPSLQRVRDVLSLVAFGAVISTTVSATVGVTSLLLGGALDSAELPAVWRTWWLGDMGGDLIAAPAVLVAATHWPWRRAPGRAIEAVGLLAALVGVSVLVFSERTALVYLVFPLLIWAALRFWQPGAAAASLIVAVVAVFATANGHGPFASAGPDERLLLAQTFVAVACVTALLLAAVTGERRRAEEAMREIAVTLQESLLPPRLPDLPRMRSATYFRAAGEGHRVGGDFYDVFETGDGAWAVAIGDVCGKGAPAAALTALARYTLRAAAVHERLPSRVLALLNDSVRRQGHAGDLCTAVYAKLELNGPGATVTLASGGHPLPLVLRDDGSVEQLGQPGMILGVDTRPPLPDASMRLRAGESVVFYTDGLIDAHAPRHVVPVSELASVLRGCAGQGPPDIVAAIRESLLDAREGEPRDDVAIVVVQVA